MSEAAIRWRRVVSDKPKPCRVVELTEVEASMVLSAESDPYHYNRWATWHGFWERAFQTWCDGAPFDTDIDSLASVIHVVSRRGR
jgi:hypothetical protein